MYFFPADGPLADPRAVLTFLPVYPQVDLPAGERIEYKYVILEEQVRRRAQLARQCAS